MCTQLKSLVTTDGYALGTNGKGTKGAREPSTLLNTPRWTQPNTDRAPSVETSSFMHHTLQPRYKYTVCVSPQEHSPPPSTLYNCHLTLYNCHLTPSFGNGPLALHCPEPPPSDPAYAISSPRTSTCITALDSFGTTTGGDASAGAFLTSFE